MWARIALMLSSLAFAIELKPPPNLPPPEEVEKRGIERKTQGKAPQVQAEELPPPPQGEPPPPPPPPPSPKEVIKPDPKELRRKPFEIRLGESLEKEKQAVKEDKNNGQSQSQNQNQKKEVVERGYCRFVQDYEVLLEPVFAQVECLMLSRPARFVRGEVLLRPEPESYALRAEVISLGGQEVKTLRVLNASKSSANVATEVNRRLISNILLRASSKTGQEVSQIVQDAFRQEGRIYYEGGGLVVERSAEEALKQVPKASMYLALANLLAAASEEVFSDKKRLPPLFRVRAGTEIYVEVQR